jgi:pimeloyl-ACP methyl ester carboxylesterase
MQSTTDPSRRQKAQANSAHAPVGEEIHGWKVQVRRIPSSDSGVTGGGQNSRVKEAGHGATQPTRGAAHTAVLSRLRGLTSALVLIAALTSCQGTATSTSSPRLALSACFVAGDQHARCGYLTVAENPAAAGGRQISLHVVVLPATTSDRAADPLFYLEGGPGGAASAEVRWVAQHFATLNRHHDIVLIDQRGTGGSNQVTCSTAGLSGAPSEAQISAVVQACLSSIKDKADPRYYTTPIAVDDFDRVRVALGYDKIDLYGVSYGVSSALAYIQRHGSHVRAAVLDSGSLLDVHLYELMPRSAEQALASLLARCQSSPTCTSAFPNLPADFASVTTHLSRSPIASPIVDPTTGGLLRLDLPTFMGMLISTYLASAQGSVSFPKDIHAAARGDWTDILKVFAGSVSSPASIPIMSITIRCSDAWASLDPSQVAAVAPGSPFTTYTEGFAIGTNLVCKYWPHAVGASGPVKSSAPIVFLNGTTDPVDPPDNVANAHADMPNSLVVPVSGIGHWQLNFDPMGCLTDEVNTFLALGVPSSQGLWGCAQSMPLPAFAI